MKKSKVGIGFFISGWYLKPTEEGKKIKKWIESDKEEIARIIGAEHEVICSDFITSREKANEEALRFLSEDVDAVLIIYLAWGEDELVLPFINNLIHKVFIIWNFYPYDKCPDKELDPVFTLYNYGSLGSLQAATVLKKLNKEIFFVTSNLKDTEAINKIKKIIKVAKIRKDLQKLEFGLLPYRCDVMLDTYTDEFKLLTKIGPKIKYISVSEYKKICTDIAENDVLEFVKEIKDYYSVDESISESVIAENARASLGLERLLDFYKLDGLSINDECHELFNEMGLRPALHTRKFSDEKKVITVEGDIDFTTAVYILKEIADDNPMMLEVKTFDIDKNEITFGHGGLVVVYSLADNSKDIVVKRDFEAENRVCSLMTEMKAKAGKVTLFNLSYSDDNFQLAVLNGYSCGGKSEMSYPHMRIKFNSNLDDVFKFFYENKISHHWVAAYGEFAEELEIMAKIAGVSFLKM